MDSVELTQCTDNIDFAVLLQDNHDRVVATTGVYYDILWVIKIAVYTSNPY